MEKSKSKVTQYSCPVLSSFHSAQPYSNSSLPNSSPPLSWLSDDKVRSWSWCFSTRQQLNSGRNLPILVSTYGFVLLLHWLQNLWLKITFTELFHIVWLQRFVLVPQKPGNHLFFHWHKNIVTNANCDCLFNHNKIKVSCVTEYFLALITNK